MIDFLKENTSKILEKDDIHEFKPLLAEIEDEPISPLGSFLFWVIIVLVIVSICWLVFGKVDVVVTARGIVVPSGYSKVIQSFDKGVIKKINIKEGQKVKKGDVLIEIDPTSTSSSSLSLNRQLENKLLEIQRLNSLSYNESFVPNQKADEYSLLVQKKIFAETLSSLEKQLSIKKQELDKIDENIKALEDKKSMNNELLKSFEDKERRYAKVLDLVTITSYQEILDNIKQYKSEIKQNEYQIVSLKKDKIKVLEEIKYIKASFKNTNLTELSQKLNEVESLKAQLKDVEFKDKKQLIVSPVDGFVDELLVHTTNGVVTPAQKLVSITPQGMPVYIKAKVLNKDAGFIKPQMPVKIKVDTFNFQKYGILKGKVKYISQNSIEDKDLGEIYEVIIQPVDSMLLVNGQKEKLRPGLSLTAEINTDKRRIIDFFVYPLIKYLDEGISVR